ncbi:SH3 domain-containing protein [Helicobacter bizzozeronii]|uniref:SH3 domain-containing protein n=1 Tax=Helicobacter bizzozeronii TaxID=56877 RepID=UPI0025575BF1|nr:SH3 domain-containing protein [Helicobacter bizzozeronii]
MPNLKFSATIFVVALLCVGCFAPTQSPKNSITKLPQKPTPSPPDHPKQQTPKPKPLTSDYYQLAQEAYTHKDYQQAKTYYQKLANLGDSRGYYGLGLVASTYVYVDQWDDIPPNYPKALEYLQKAAKMGNAPAHIKLGDFYIEAKGVFLNPQKAIAHYLEGARLGDVQGYYKLGVLYRDGKGIPPDLAKALGYFQQATDQGDTLSALALGVIFRDQAKPRQALEHFQKAASQGSSLAYTLLGDMYANGYGVPKDIEHAQEYYKKAKSAKLHTEQEILADPLRLPQKASYYLAKNTWPIPSPAKLKSAYLKRWYAPWKSMKRLRAKDVFWVKYSLLNPGYQEDGSRHDPQVLRHIYTDMDMPHYPSAHLKGVILANTSVRAVPTDLAYYPTPQDYPSDLWQNSLIFAGTPVLITHYNKAKTYALIQSSFVVGWVRIQDVAPIHASTIHKILHLKDYLTPLSDTDPKARMGQIFLQVPHTPDRIYTFSQDTKGYAKLTPTPINPQNFTPFPRPFTPKTMATVIDTLLGQRYGWGGLDSNRDCSAFTRDSFAGFGVFLPRNSRAQVRYAHNTIDLSKMSAAKKEAYIIKHATPFATILWLQGHIMLYLGTYHNQAIVAHNIWSISTSKTRKQEHLYHVERAVITTLRLGEEHKSGLAQPNLLINRIDAMSDLYTHIAKSSH